MNGEHNIPGLAEKIEQAKQERDAAAAANAVPLPGPLGEAFSPCQDIKVNSYTVRPFYDIDFEILQMVDHPLARMALGGERYGETIKDLRGKSAWIICWLLTHGVDEVDDISQGGRDAVEKAARKEFGKKQLGELLQISSAVIEQFGRYFSTVVGLSAADAEDGGGGKASKKA